MVHYQPTSEKTKDYMVTNPGLRLVFRSDNMILNFKDLSVREIELSPYPHS